MSRVEALLDGTFVQSFTMLISSLTEVQVYMKHCLDTRTTAFPGGLEIAIVNDLSPDVPSARGHLKSTTPEEQRHALVLAIDADMAAGKTDDELQEWRTCVLSTVVCFKRYTNDDDIFWAARNIRETIGAQYEAVYYSTVPSLVLAK
jgi:hypothetical protein